MGPVILVAVVALAVVAAVAWPLVRNRGDDAGAGGGDDRRQALQDDIDQSLRAIREIDFDHKTGNLGDADFAELDAVERARAAELLRQRDITEG
jgi:hypothetical protein